MSLDVASLRINGSKAGGDLLAALVSIDLDAAADQVAQLTLTVSDDAAALLARPGLLSTGASVSWRGADWEVSSVATNAPDDNTIEHAFSAREPLARALRRKIKPSVRQGISPSAWVAAAVKGTTDVPGVKAVVAPSNARPVIGQRGGNRPQRTLDVIADLASDLDWSWCVRGKTLYFGSRKWALDTAPAGTKTWPVTFRSGALLNLDLAIDEDDDANLGSGELSLAFDAAPTIQPWDRIALTGAGRYSGTWLVESVKVSGEPGDAIELSLAWPRKPSPRKARTG